MYNKHCEHKKMLMILILKLTATVINKIRESKKRINKTKNTLNYSLMTLQLKLYRVDGRIRHLFL